MNSPRYVSELDDIKRRLGDIATSLHSISCALDDMNGRALTVELGPESLREIGEILDGWRRV